MLMMVDPNVHFHVIPRYSEPRSWGGIDFPDAGWPGPPRVDLDRAMRHPVEQVGKARFQARRDQRLAQ
jgi:diadenosine tetraphosphate (Ap4A) HIT family hydrolase